MQLEGKNVYVFALSIHPSRPAPIRIHVHVPQRTDRPKREVVQTPDHAPVDSVRCSGTISAASRQTWIYKCNAMKNRRKRKRDVRLFSFILPFLSFPSFFIFVLGRMQPPKPTCHHERERGCEHGHEVLYMHVFVSRRRNGRCCRCAICHRPDPSLVADAKTRSRIRSNQIKSPLTFERSVGADWGSRIINRLSRHRKRLES